MRIFLWIISVVWGSIGLIALIAPPALKKFYSGFLTKPTKRLSVMPLTGGLLFLWAAPASSYMWLMRFLGVIGLIKGLFFLLYPVDVVKDTLNWWLDLPSKTHRLYGAFLLALAGVVISSIL